MKDYSRLTPEGTKDMLFEDVANHNAVTERLRSYLSQRGYKEVRTPALEYYDIFQSRRTHFAQESLYKLTDHTGRLIVLRPDSTIPMARLAASKLREAPMPLRLFYCQSVYRISRSLDGLSHEQAQMGLEIIGAQGKKADLEVLAIAAGLFQDLGLKDFRLELGHVLPAQALIEALPLEEREAEAISRAIAEKNQSALEKSLAPWQDYKEALLLRRLPQLFGTGELLDQVLAEIGEDFSEIRGALEDLKAYYDALVLMGLKDHILIDLGLVREADYYTGVVFRAYLGGAGREVLSGGRYDQLLEGFGSRCPAVGLGVELDLLAEAWAKQSSQSSIAPIVYYADPKLAPQALAEWPQAPAPLIFSDAESLEAARLEAQALGAQALWIYQADYIQKEELDHA